MYAKLFLFTQNLVNPFADGFIHLIFFPVLAFSISFCYYQALRSVWIGYFLIILFRHPEIRIEIKKNCSLIHYEFAFLIFFPLAYFFFFFTIVATLLFHNNFFFSLFSCFCCSHWGFRSSVCIFFYQKENVN